VKDLNRKIKVAVIGGGVAGIVSAYRLQQHCDVSIFEAASYLGGHTSTIEIEEGEDKGLCIDTGFIVLNDRTYPLFTRFLSEIDVAIRYSDMSFSVYCPEKNLQYCSRTLGSLFAQKRNIFRLEYLKMLFEISRFWKVASADLSSALVNNESLKSFLDRNNFSQVFRNDFLYPLAAAVWSSSDKLLESFPALTFLTFFRNHGWLSYADQPRWQTVVGGSFSYVKKFKTLFNGVIRLNSKVTSVSRNKNNSFSVITEDGRKEEFDQIVCALHADQVPVVFRNLNSEEKELFLSWKYSKNLTILHTDQSFMPPLKAAWGSWNYRKELAENSSEPVSVTYDMNNLQGLTASKNYFVTLNPRKKPQVGSLIKSFMYTHPIYNADSVAAQSKLKLLNGVNGVWYCGSYFGFGFHEDSVKSAEEAAKGLLKTTLGIC
jgi:predicted NAD/FAD-binding protein